MENEQKNQYLIPASIVVAGLLVAFAVFYTNGAPIPKDQGANVLGNDTKAENMRPVDSSDHILGDPNAPVKIVEYSDLECPFCKDYHPTLTRVMSEYGKDGKVAWVYRHFPLDAIHSRARKEAEASECAAELGGNNAFWAYIGKVFEITPSNNGLDPSKLPLIAQQIWLDKTNFESCLSSGRYAEKIQENYADAVNSGGDGTPYTIIITSKGEVYPFSGALPYAQLQPLIEDAIKSI